MHAQSLSQHPVEGHVVSKLRKSSVEGALLLQLGPQRGAKLSLVLLAQLLPLLALGVLLGAPHAAGRIVKLHAGKGG